MDSRDTLIAAAAKVDVIDVAGRIISNPRRHFPTLAEGLALACAAESFHGVMVEAQLLVRALQLPITGNDASDAARDHAIQTQVAILTHEFATLRYSPNPEAEKEVKDGNASA